MEIKFQSLGALGTTYVPAVPARSDPQITAILGISSIGNREFIGSFPNIEAENHFVRTPSISNKPIRIDPKDVFTLFIPPRHCESQRHCESHRRSKARCNTRQPSFMNASRALRTSICFARTQIRQEIGFRQPVDFR